jgi:oligosaccharyltransferase complex subunit delta (ribophorin II)
LDVKSAAVPTVTLGARDTLRLNFQVSESQEDKGVQPHQTFLRLHDPVSGEDGIVPIRVSAGGKAKLEIVRIILWVRSIHILIRFQNMAKPPSGLPPTTADQPLHATLLLGSHIYAPAALSLFELILPASHPAPVAADEATFHPLPEIFHTFRPEQKLPPKFISAVFAGVVLAPWTVLLFLVRVICLSWPEQ